MGRTFKNIIIVVVWLVLAISPGGVKSAYADEADIFLSNLQPNVLIILDNSNSFDEDFLGNPIGSYTTGSRSVESRRQLLSLVNANVNNMRIGLMTFHLTTTVCANGNNPVGVCPEYLSNAPYFVSYSTKSYCPTPPAEPGCYDYCLNGTVSSGNTCNTGCQAGNANFSADYTLSDPTGQDAIIATYALGSANRAKWCSLIYPKVNEVANPTNPGKYIYYDLPGQNYYYINEGNAFCYAHSNYTVNAPGTSIWNCYSQKTNVNDGWSGYGGTHIGDFHYTPTDEDLALGFTDFGIRNITLYTGQAWLAMSSPGGGYLQVPCAPYSIGQLNSLTAKLAMNENNMAGYMSCAAADRNTCSYIVNAGNTPTQGTFQSAAEYFQGGTDYQNGASYTSPIQAWCQNNFIILATDGLPDTNPSGGTDTAADLISGVVSQITALQSLTTPAVPGYTFSIPVYVLGMALTAQSKPLLDQMAVAGGTADANGHAYYADNPTELAAALAAIPQDIISKTYSFTVASVSSSRVTDENYLYEASFTPVNSDPFWHGYLQQYNLNADGTLGSVNWEAGALLAAQNYTTRNLYTSHNGSLITFDTTIPLSRLGVPDNPTRNAVVGYIQGNPTYNPDNWKLGDIFHSTPINVGTPNVFFEDTRDQSYASYSCNGTTILANAFDQFRCVNQRTSANGLRRIVAGANDGQFHSFNTQNGSEMWSFIPPNLLPQLQNTAHASNPSALPHQYLVDGPVTVADVWWQSAGGTVDGTSKVEADWHTMTIFGEGDGGVNLWSSDAQCDNNLQGTYDSAHKHYCGYYAFDVTNTSSPPAAFNWLLGGSSGLSAANATYMGAPWSKMMVGRVTYNKSGQIYEKWVGFIGGGYNGANCSGGGACGVCDCRGLGFYVVDLSNGQILWSYTYGNDANMQYPIPAAPAIVDIDQDGFIDTAYVGDLGGNMWRFKFCRAGDMPNCGISGQAVNWTGGRLYSSATAQPIFQTAAVAVDNQQNTWVYWGTGNHMSPKDTTTSDTIFAVKDDDRTTTYTIGGLKNVTSSGASYGTGDTTDGYYINLQGTGEKMLADPTVFGGVVYFTTYTPPTGGGDLCAQSGTSSLYALNYTSGNGAFGGSSRSMSLGAGIASSPMVSMKPGGSTVGDIYVTLSGGSGVSASTQRVNFNPPGLTNRVNILNWKDRRVQ
jgi:type IV pilus assembly protein PilY1